MEENKTVATTEVAKVEKKEVAEKRTADFDNEIYSSSDNWQMAYSMAKAMAESTIVPQSFQRNSANCMLAVSQAQRLKIDPITVANNLYLIQGKMSWKSEFLIAMINQSGKFDIELQYEETKDKDGKPFSCTCWSVKDGRKVIGITVDMDMARAEKWTDKPGSKWKTIPQIMLRYRAAAFFARFNCPELTSGMYTREEYEDNDFNTIKKQKSKASLNDLLQDDEPLTGEIIDG